MTCRSCGAAIRWVKTPAGKSMPIDAAPASPEAKPNVVFTDGLTMAIVKPGDGTHLSHFSTCPNSASHRKRKATA